MSIELTYEIFIPTKQYVDDERDEIYEDGYYDEFTYEPYESDVESYIKRTHSEEDVFDDFLREVFYPQWKDEYRNEFKKQFDIDGDVTVESLMKLDKEDREELFDDAIIDLIYGTDVYYDELKDYFEDEAMDYYRYG